MTALLRIELLKLRTAPAAWVALVLTALLTVTSVFSSVLLAGVQGAPAVGTVGNMSKVFATGVVSAHVMLVLGIMMAAGEDRHRTILATYLGEPRRGRVLVAKLVTAGGLGLLYGALTFALTLAVAAPLYATKGVHDYPVSIGALWLGTTLLTGCFGLLGVALGALTRNTVGAIVGALGWVFLIELAILQPLLPTVAKWLPTGAAIALTTPVQVPGTNLAPALAALVLVGWATAVALLASRVTLNRELR
jgi:ABC-2 type transport system permease protein